MGYDGKLLNRAKTQYEADKQRRQEAFLARQEAI